MLLQRPALILFAMSKPLQQKVALITGASRGIGKAIAFELAHLGASIMVNYVRNEEAAVETVTALRDMGSEAHSFQANAGDGADQTLLVDETFKLFGGVDILVHNAAIGAFKPVHKLKPNQWDLSMTINTRALLELTQKVLPSMESRGGGSIIALSSLGSHRFIPNYGAIGISKAALESLIKYLAVELSPKGIRVNGVSGGLVDTDAVRHFPEFEKFRDEVVRRTPAGRIGAPEDLARVVAFLASPQSAWIYGQILTADGGLSLI